MWRLATAPAGRRLRRAGLGLDQSAVLLLVACLALASGGGGGAVAQVPPAVPSAAAAKAFRHPDLFVGHRHRPLEELPAPVAARKRSDLAALGVAPGRGFLDLRGGRWGTLLLTRPLVPGTGAGNELTWSHLGQAPPAGRRALESAAWQALSAYLRAHSQQLGVDVDEMATPPRVTIHDGGALIQIHARRVYRGIPVRGAALTAVVNHGNLVLLGTRSWGSLRLSTVPAVAAPAALGAVRDHLAPLAVVGLRRKVELLILPMAAGAPDPAAPGGGYRHRLAWSLEPEIGGEPGRWEALVDAHSGELLAFEDRNRYATTRMVVGGVYPLTNDGSDPGGVEQAGYPMPFADVTAGGRRLYTDGGGNLPLCAAGDVGTSLDGRFVRIVELCGAIDETSAGDLDLGTSAGTDCAVPAGASAGNTHSARTGFYELNRMRETALGQLPGNRWLQSQLIAIMNFPPDLLGCNAFWDGSTVTFFSGDPGFAPAGCSNTGELAGVLDHEWGHGLDDNDANGMISNPGEGIADVYTALRLNDSCIARGFYKGTACDPGDGDPCVTCGVNDPCVTCDGVRDIDWARRTSGAPHDIAFIDSSCPAGIGDPGPCGGAVHCEGALVSEAAWDLLTRDLPGGSPALDFNTSLEIVTRLFYRGAGAVDDWFQCSPGSGTGDGCNAGGGYLNLLAADDDNGDLDDGTPHMSAIHAAFDRHGIACATPTVQNGGCSGAPTTAPVVTATPVDRGARLSWTAVPGATSYAVYRTEGVHGCDFGKARVGETTATELTDQGLANGREYSYVVLPVGAAPSCLGPASACTVVTPAAGPNLGIDAGSVALLPLGGDLDEVIDNCENARLAFDLHNIGAGALTDVLLVGVEVLSHPATVSVTSPLPAVVAPSLAECAAAPASFDFHATGLAHADAIEFRVHVTADELAGGVRSATLRLTAAETDLEAYATRTYSFESDLDGWEVQPGGTFDHTPGSGAVGSSAYLASSANLPDQCDRIRSPLLRLSPASTLSLWNQFDIEGPLDLLGFRFWFDRANVGVVDTETGQRTTVSPDGGRLYNAGGTDGSCVTENQDGWADSMPTWDESTWTAAALDAGRFAGKIVQLEVAYGTDVAEEGFGFWFDELTLTGFEQVVADGQADVCDPANVAPVAVGDLALPANPGAVTVAVLGNDSDPDGDPLRLLAVAQPANGGAVIDPIGPDLDTITYTAAGCFVGVDAFDYSVTDSRGGSDIATLTVDLSGLAGQIADDLVLAAETVSTSKGFRGCSSITGGAGFEVVAPGNAAFVAGSLIVLEDGFSVAPGATFTAEIDPSLAPPSP